MVVAIKGLADDRALVTREETRLRNRGFNKRNEHVDCDRDWCGLYSQA